MDCARRFAWRSCSCTSRFRIGDMAVWRCRPPLPQDTLERGTIFRDGEMEVSAGKRVCYFIVTRVQTGFEEWPIKSDPLKALKCAARQYMQLATELCVTIHTTDEHLRTLHEDSNQLPSQSPRHHSVLRQIEARAGIDGLKKLGTKRPSILYRSAPPLEIVSPRQRAHGVARQLQ
jgi:hypothetical protein